MFPRNQLPSLVRCAFLCLRRGVSSRTAAKRMPPFFSLPTQRCFYLVKGSEVYIELFSAYAEVFPLEFVPSIDDLAFLCLRRGVSRLAWEDDSKVSFSLPTQRCFLIRNPIQTAKLLFSAYAEVFPSCADRSSGGCPFLCLRRGVSDLRRWGPEGGDFSLPTQRCF